MDKLLIEICCGSAEDALLAFAAGSDRVELNAALESGGLTPSLGELKIVKREYPYKPVICMVRPRAGGFCYSELEYETMLADMQILMREGAAGIAFGFLTADGQPDAARCAAAAQVIGKGDVVFHRAFDCTVGDPLPMVDALAGAGVTRILTSGRETDALAGAQLIAACQKRAAGRLQLLPGGGVRSTNAREIERLTGCFQVHFSCHSDMIDESGLCNKKLNFDCSAPHVTGAVKRLDSERLKSEICKINIKEL